MSTSSEESKPKQRSDRNRVSGMKLFLSGIVSVLILAAIALFVVAKVGVARAAEHPVVVFGAQVFALPVASINGSAVGYADYLTDLDALRVFSSANPDQGAPSDDQLSDRVLSRLLAGTLVRDLADEFDVEVDEAALTGAEQELKDQFADQAALEQEMQNNFGWSYDTFVERILRPSLLEQSLAQAYMDGEISEGVTAGDDDGQEQVRARHILFQVGDETDKEEVKAEAQAVLERIKNGEDFAELAAEFGSDATRDVGGDLGWFFRGQMVPAFEEAAFGLEAGALAPELVETEFGFHIVETTDRRTVKDFSAFMNNQLKTADIKIYSDIHDPFAELR